MQPTSTRKSFHRHCRISTLTAFGLLGLASVATLPAQAELAAAIRNLDKDVQSTIDALPKLLSQTGLYTNIGNKATRAIADTNAIVAFEVNSALWSDGSHKERFISVPAGMKVTPTDSALYTFPDNTVLIKNFAVDTIYKNTASRIYVETRFLVYQSTASAKKWTGISYKWKRDQSDAELVSTDSPLDTSIRVILNGIPVGKRWHYPSMTDCAACHKGDETSQRGTLGFITQQLNRNVGGVNQLQRLVNKGVLTVNPLTAKPGLSRWYGLTDTATLEQRSRSYLASNCSHCHGNKVIMSNLHNNHNFDYFNPSKKVTYKDDSVGGWVGKPPESGVDFPSVVHAGSPESSLVMGKFMFRRDDFLTTEDFSQMPPIATSQVDTVAANVIRDWICSLKPGTSCKNVAWLPDEIFWDTAEVNSLAIRHGLRGGKTQARASIHGGLLMIPSALKATETVEMRDSHGRLVPLRAAGNSQYRLPADLPAGAYLVRAGAYSTLLHYLP